MATIARLVTAIEYTVEGQQKIQASLDSVTEKMDGISTVASSVGKAIVGAFAVEKIAGFVTSLVNAGDRIDDLANLTGISVGKIQELQFAFAGSGVSVDQMAGAIAQLSKRLIEGDTGAVNALRELGLKADDLIRMSPDQAFLRIAEAIRQVPNPMQQSALAMELFGRSGAQLLPVLRQNLEELMKTARETGAVMNDETVAAAARLSDMWERLKLRTAALTANTIEYVAEHNRLTLAINDVSSIANFVSHGNAMEDVLNRIKSPVSWLSTKGLPDLTLSHKDLIRVQEQLTNDALKKIEDGLKRQQQEAQKAADEHRKLQAIIGLGHMKAAQEFVEAMQLIRSDLMAFNATIDEVTENFRNKWSQGVTVTLYDSARVADEVFGRIRDRGMAATEDMGVSFSNWADLTLGGLEEMSRVYENWQHNQRSVLQNVLSYWQGLQQGTRGVMKIMQGDMSGWVDVVIGGFRQILGVIGLLRSAWEGLKKLFGGGEEGVVVNPARDKFLSQWGDPSNKGVGGAGHNLAALLTELGAGDGGGAMFAALQRADTMALFRPAAEAIVSFLQSHGRDASINFHSGGMVPGTGEVPATLLGGERVQSREEVGEMRGLLGEFRDLKFRLLNAIETSPSQMRAQVQIQRGLGASA
jgi:hypothetical protein